MMDFLRMLEERHGITEKDLLKFMWVGLCMGFLLVVFSYHTLPEAMSCTYTHPITEETVSGNCTWLYYRFFEKTSLDYSYAELKNGTRVDPNPVGGSLRLAEIIVTSSTSTTSTSSTTSTTCPACPKCHCPDCAPCVCEECHKCPSCDFELTPEQIEEALNAHPKTGAGVYQSGWYDAKKLYLEMFEVPGRPKFSERPSSGAVTLLYQTNKDLSYYKFRRDGDMFTLNNSLWSLENDSSEIRIYRK